MIVSSHSSQSIYKVPTISCVDRTVALLLPCDSQHTMTKRLFGRYELLNKLGEGSFGEIFRAKDLKTGVDVAIKREECSTGHPQLHYENGVYRSIPPGTGFAKIYHYGDTESYRVLVMELLGKSLEALFDDCGRKFTLKTLTMLMIQLVDRLEYLHENDYVHRDIKPENFVVGSSDMDNHVVYLIDLGLCKAFRDRRSKRHISDKSGKKLTGTPRYASIYTHEGKEQGRRDDLLSLGYMILYFHLGELPWQGKQAPTKEAKYKLIADCKRSTRLEDLCRGLPDGFKEYMQYCRNLAFQERPDYSMLKGIFQGILAEQGLEADWRFDWNDLQTHSAYLRSSSRDTTADSRLMQTSLVNTIAELEFDRNRWRQQARQYEVVNLQLSEEVRSLRSRLRDYEFPVPLAMKRARQAPLEHSVLTDEDHHRILDFHTQHGPL